REEIDIEQEVAELRRSLTVFDVIEELERRMFESASLLDFEKAAKYRDAIKKLKGEIEGLKNAKVSKRGKEKYN
ncbi:MAG: UvrB/UvrC motif-containing protein, partial [candidate division WOR-3 bacterium]